MNKSVTLLSKGKVAKKWQSLFVLMTVIYAVAVGVMCFMPQPTLFEGVQTPNVIYWWRLRFLLVPFNSLLGLSQVDSWFEVVWIFTQNLLNIFLLFPLILGLLFLVPNLRTAKRATLLALAFSLFIESTQLVLDALFNANRVFEIDDLWTNTLGGYLAFLAFKLIIQKVQLLTKNSG